MHVSSKPTNSQNPIHASRFGRLQDIHHWTRWDRSIIVQPRCDRVMVHLGDMAWALNLVVVSWLSRPPFHPWKTYHFPPRVLIPIHADKHIVLVYIQYPTRIHIRLYVKKSSQHFLLTFKVTCRIRDRTSFCQSSKLFAGAFGVGDGTGLEGGVLVAGAGDFGVAGCYKVCMQKCADQHIA